MNEPLSVAENQVLTHLLTDGGAVEERDLDAEVLRGLSERGLVRCLAGFAIISNKGRDVLRGTPSPETPWLPAPKPPRQAEPTVPEAAAPPAPADVPAPRAAPAPAEDATPKLNPLQEELLRRLVQEPVAVPVDDLDGRVVRALEGRGLVRRNTGVLELTDAGRDFYERHVRRRRRARSGWLRVGGTAPGVPADPADPAEERRQRADELRRAIAALEQALSDQTPIDVGDLSATAGDALAGLRELADRVERGEDPRRISRGRP